MQIQRDCRLYRIVVERKVLNDGHGETYWKDVRAYVVIASSTAEARHALDPLFQGESIRIVEEQVKSPYAYLLSEGDYD